jgi:hypothetical protein
MNLMVRGRLDDARRAIDDWSAKPDPLAPLSLPSTKGLLLAVKEDFHAAEAEIRIALAAHPLKDPVYHHAAYDIACIYDIGRNSHRAFGRVAEADGGLRLHGAQRGLRALNAVAREE